MTDIMAISRTSPPLLVSQSLNSEINGVHPIIPLKLYYVALYFLLAPDSTSCQK